jgi:hypothetical protein
MAGSRRLKTMKTKSHSKGVGSLADKLMKYAQDKGFSEEETVREMAIAIGCLVGNEENLEMIQAYIGSVYSSTQGDGPPMMKS